MGTQRPPSSSGAAIFGLAPNVASMIAYAPCCVGLVFSILVVAMEKQNRGVRFDAVQSLLLNVAAFVVAGVFMGLAWLMAAIAAVLGFLTTMMMCIVLLAVVAMQVLLMIKANAGEEIELPFLGEVARKVA